MLSSIAVLSTDTTDVQKVTATVSAEAITVQCMFVNGSTARGCMVVLVGHSDNVTVNLTREGLNCVMDSSENITGVIAYDIESDGTVGTLAIFGELSNGTLTCLPSERTTEHHLSEFETVITVILRL